MKKIDPISLLVLLISFLVTSETTIAKSLAFGSIEFPKTIKTVPSIRIYYLGQIVSTNIDSINKSLSYNISKAGNPTQFNVLITPQIGFGFLPSKYQSTISNTPTFLKLKPRMPYKFYSFQLVSAQNHGKLTYHWQIEEKQVDDPSLKIPDDAIVICLNPEWISIKSSTTCELPSISISPRSLELCGFEQGLHDALAKIRLIALDSDRMHSVQEEVHVKQQENRLIIAPPIAA